MEGLFKLFFVCSYIFAFSFISSCSAAGINQRGVYDDAQKISAIGDSYTYVSKTGNVQADQLSFDIKGFFGKETVWELVAEEECEIDLIVSADVKSGKFKLSLVSCDSAVTTIFEGSQDGVCPVTLTAGTNRIIMVGSNANCIVNVIMPADIADKPVIVKPIQKLLI